LVKNGLLQLTLIDMDEYETNRIKSLITLHEQIIEDKKEIILKLIDEIAEERLTIQKLEFEL
jgi:tRNA A37 threonylcarbamoyladenosine dehydratase